MVGKKKIDFLILKPLRLVFGCFKSVVWTSNLAVAVNLTVTIIKYFTKKSLLENYILT